MYVLRLPLWCNPCAPISAGGRAACTDHAPIWKPTDARTQERKVSRTLHSRRQRTLPRFPGERRLVAADSFARLHLALRTGGSFSRIRFPSPIRYIAGSSTFFLFLFLDGYLSLLGDIRSVYHSFIFPHSREIRGSLFQSLYLVVYFLLNCPLVVPLCGFLRSITLKWHSYVWFCIFPCIELPVFHLISFSAFPSFSSSLSDWVSFVRQTIKRTGSLYEYLSNHVSYNVTI